MAIRQALAGLALAAATTSGPISACQHHDTTNTPPQPATSTPTAKAKATGSTDSDGEIVEFDAMCDTKNHAYNVKPPTKKAKAAAEKRCQSTGKAIDDAPWPSGMSAIPLPNH